jgi:hypothetical protein
MQRQRPQHRRQRVGGADREIDAPGNDDEGHAHRHDRDETRVLGQLREVLGVEKLVLLDEGRHPLAVLVHCEHPFARAIFRHPEFRRAHGTAE